MQRADQSVAVVLEDDTVARSELCSALHALGYLIDPAADIPAALELLRNSERPVLTVFEIEPHGNSLSGLDYTMLIGTLLTEPLLTSRHQFAVVTDAPDDAEDTVGHLLRRLHIALLPRNCTAEAILLTLGGETYRPTSTDGSGLHN